MISKLSIALLLVISGKWRFESIIVIFKWIVNQKFFYFKLNKFFQWLFLLDQAVPEAQAVRAAAHQPAARQQAVRQVVDQAIA